MAQGFLESFDKRMVVCSAGTQASGVLNQDAVRIMAEAGIDISRHTSDPVEQYASSDWDYVITVCDGARETCPVFHGNVKHRLHIGFEDPSMAVGSDEFIRNEFIRVRDQIKERFYRFYQEEIKPRLCINPSK